MDQRTYVQNTITLLTAARTDPNLLDQMLDEVDLKAYMKAMFVEMAETIPKMQSGEFDVDEASELMKSGNFDAVISDMALRLAEDSTY